MIAKRPVQVLSFRDCENRLVIRGIQNSAYNRPMTPRAREFKEAFERDLPEYARMCVGEEPVIIFHQDAFAADYQPNEFTLLGMAIKYAG